MSTAHEHAGVTYRTPHADEPKKLPSRIMVAYGYERSLEESPLDVRLPAYRPVPAGWLARHLLFSSGMAALSGIMQTVPAILGPRSTPPLRPFDVQCAARRLAALEAPPLLVIDSTLVGPSLPMTRILDETRALPLIVQASSGLKLDQAGLELANVGIVSLYASSSRQAQLDAAEERLRLARRLNGTALTIDTVALLDIPFFLDPATFYEHCTAVFAHNARLARAVRTGFPRPSLRVGRTWRRAGHLRDHSRRDDLAVDQRPLPIGDAPRGEEYERPQPFSMPTFFDPGYDHRVACVPSCRPAHGEPRYRACTVAEHMREMAHTTLSTAEPILAV